MAKKKTIARLEAEIKVLKNEHAADQKVNKELLDGAYNRIGQLRKKLDEKSADNTQLKLVIQRNDGRIDALLTTIVMFQNRDLAFQQHFAKLFGVDDNVALAIPEDKIQTDQVMERKFQFNSGTWKKV